MLEAVASIIFASPRCSDVPELLQVLNLFTTKYGKDFVSAAAELRPDSGVNRVVIEKLSVAAPPVDKILKVLKEIANEHNLDWDSSITEKEFSKKHEDLLDGSIPMLTKYPPLSNPTNISSPKVGQHEPKDHNNPTSRRESPSSMPKNVAPKSSDREPKANQRPSDAMERAQAALATAEHALAAARAAAELSKVKLFTQESPKQSD